MSSLIRDLQDKTLIDPPNWLASNTHYLALMGSVAYGVSGDASDCDIYGVVIPPKHFIFPQGYIRGFGSDAPNFEQWIEHDVVDKSNRKRYDFTVRNITKYFHLAMGCNPDCIDSLFVPRECILHSTRMWEIVRENRKIFLHKGLAHKCKGYAYSQINKANNCRKYVKEIREFEEKYDIPETTTYEQANKYHFYEPLAKLYDNGKGFKLIQKYIELWDIGLSKTKRFESQKIHNQDNKFLYHVYRLADQAIYVLTNGDLDLQEVGRKEKMKAIRRGDIKQEDVVKTFEEQEKTLESLLQTSVLPKYPNEEKIKQLLLTCLEDHYGSLEKVYQSEDKYSNCLTEIQQVMRRYGV